MPEATFDLLTMWTMKLYSLSRIFGTWCFHQLYSMIMCGFHHLVCVQMENERLWLKDAIKHEIVELIFLESDGQTLEAIKDGAHTYSSLE